MNLSLLITAVLCCVGVVESDKPRHCSEYMVSGLYGVSDDALTASSTHKSNLPGNDFFPKNSRLYSSAPTVPSPYTSSAAWCSDALDTNQYLQVQLRTTTTIHDIKIQGREHFPHWVKSFFVQYSMDGTQWTTVLSSDGSPKLFPGNTDSTIVMTNELSPDITALFVRINPQSWNEYVCLRFDLGGCSLYNTGHSKFIKASVPDSLANYQASESFSSSETRCAVACHQHAKCMSFQYDARENTCHEYNRSMKTSFSSGEIPYFTNTGLLDHLYYRSDYGGRGIFKVNEIRLNYSSAAITCEQQFSQLIKIDSALNMAFLENQVASNKIMLEDFRFYVSGKYTGSKWHYNDGEEIDSVLLASSNLYPNQGHCIALIQTGLTSVDCTQEHFFICGH